MPNVRPWRLAPAALCLSCAVAQAGVSVSVTPLVSDDAAAHPAQLIDPGLVNAWGLSYSAAGPFWVSSNGAGTSTVYAVDPLTQATRKVALTVSVPGAGNVTGQVFNSGGAGQFGGNNFLFVSEDGTVSGWRGALGTTAEPLHGVSAFYKGAALASVDGHSYLYAADFHGGGVNVFKGSVDAPVLAGSFQDPTLPAGYGAFNVQALAGSLYVAYARQDPGSADEVAGAGFGYVDRYDLQGRLLGRVASGGALNAPWGMAIAPDSFGAWAGALLVGNFGDGRINAYDRSTHSFLGQLSGADGQPLSIEGLWALGVGNGGAAGSTHALYFTAGPDDESHGLFGVMQAVPEPGTWAMLLAGLLVVALRAGPWRRPRRLVRLAGAASGLALCAALPAQAQVFGSLANFDAVNDTGHEAYGFEIDIEDATYDRSKLYSVFGLDRNFGVPPASVERYGAPTLLDLAGGGIGVRYQAHFGPQGWDRFTPTGPYPNAGDSCWALGNPAYNSGSLSCDHFGVATYGSPAKVSYSWLVDPGNTGTLTKQAAAIPAVNFAYQPPAPNAPPAPQPVVAEIEAHKEANEVFGTPYWVKVYARHLDHDVVLENLMQGHPDVPGNAEVETEFEIFQAGDANQGKLAQLALNPGDAALVLRYEFYKYLGAVSAEGEALCGGGRGGHGGGGGGGGANPLDCGGLGAYVGAQMAGFNAVQPAVPEPATWALMLGGMAMLWGAARRRNAP